METEIGLQSRHAVLSLLPGPQRILARGCDALVKEEFKDEKK